MNLELLGTEAGELFVDRAAGERGSKAPFFHAYEDDGGQRRWGYVCGNCDGTANAVDTMGRIECNTCGNLKKPDGWDDAHE
ncbi:DUF5816 domain-containing protein [Halobaculum sp. MBLA0147]|uniref:DUF5816 domain-containing protein n=1 Tax=Halobaculum sp. MBLA0147 TaxID=3079934 RepID=UPI003525E959